MDTCWNILLVPLEDCSRHGGEVYDEISNLAIKLILVGVPLSAIATRDVGIVVNESDSREARVPLNDRLVIRISNKLSIIIPIVQEIFISQTGVFFLPPSPPPPSQKADFYVRGKKIGEEGEINLLNYWRLD